MWDMNVCVRFNLTYMCVWDKRFKHASRNKATQRRTNPPNGDGEIGHKRVRFYCNYYTENKGSLWALALRKKKDPYNFWIFEGKYKKGMLELGK